MKTPLKFWNMKTSSGRLVAATTVLALLSFALCAPAPAQSLAERVNLTIPSEANIQSKAQAASAVSRTVTARPSATDEALIEIDNASNYGFDTATNGTFTDMSTGTTQLVAAGADDSASLVTNIGFDFYFQGTRFTQFSANSNGYIRLGATAVGTTQYTLGTANVPLITAYGSDMIVSTSGRVHYKVTGVAPNRVLTVEFLNITIIYDGLGTSADGTYQVRLYESTGAIEFVYGQMNRNTGTGFAGANNVQYVGFSLNSTDNTYATVTTSTNTVNTTGALASNLPTNGAPIPNLNTPVNGSRRVYSFTPPVPTAPTSLTFTGVTPLAMTLNWVDSPDETLYAIYRSTDGTNYTFDGTAAQNATSYSATGLSPSTTYFWKVYAVSDGALSSALAGNQATTAGGSIASTAAGGNWSATTTWVGGVVPTINDNVTIVDGATVTIDTAANALSLTVGQGASGVLQYEPTTARTLTVATSVTIGTGGIFQSATTGTQTSHVLSVGANLTNNGTLDLSTNANTAGAGLTFTGANSNTFGGTGATTDIRTMTINKGTSNANILELNTTSFTVQGGTTDGTPMAYLTLTNGTLKISGTFTLTGRTFTTAAYTIGATAGFWLNNPNYVVAGQNGSPTQNGLLRITQGTFNVGTASGNSMTPGAASSITIEGGAMNVAGRLSSTTNAGINYTQSGGTLTVCTVGNTSSSNPCFGFETGVNFVMSGGTIILQLRSTATTPLDYSMFGTFNVTGGTLQIGNASTLASSSFVVRGGAPNVVINNATAGRTALINGANSLTIFGNLTVNTGTTLSQTSTGSCVVNGNPVQVGNVVNNGTISNASATGSNRFQFFSTTGAQTYSGSGTFGSAGTPYAGVGISNNSGVTISSPMTLTRMNLFNGPVTGASNLTFGGGATATIIQVSQTGSLVQGGSLDAAPTFNTTGHTLLYLQEPVARTTGFEIPSSRIILNSTMDNTSGVNLSGNLSVTGTLTLTNGNFTIGANTLTLALAPAGTATNLKGNATSSLTLNGTTAINVPSSITSLNNLTLNNTGGSTLQANLTVNSLNLTNGVLTIGARTLGINGPITVGTGSLTGGATSQIVIGGSGAQVNLPAVSGGLQTLTVNRDGGLLLAAPLSINGAGPALVLTNGPLNNSSNNVTLASGTFLRRDTGSILVAPIFGATVDVSYQGATPVTTGPEMPVSPTVLRTLQVNSAGITLGSSPVVNLQLLLDSGVITTGANVLNLASTVAVTRTTGYVDGNLARTFTTPSTLTYDLGAGGVYSPVIVNALALSSPTVLPVKAVNSSVGGLNPAQSLQRHWAFGSSAVTQATLTFMYDQSDVPGMANEAQFRVVRKRTVDQRFIFPNGATDNVDQTNNAAVATMTTMPDRGAFYTLAQANAPGAKVGDPRSSELFDFDGSDGRTDVTIWNPNTGDWYITDSLTNSTRVHVNWGSQALGDILVPGDYDGDTRTDLAVWRPSDGNWYVISSVTDAPYTITNWGGTGDKPLVGDFDGDGKTDFVIWRPSEGNWYILKSSGGTVIRQWGASTDKPVPADYDGDGLTDIAVYRPDEGNWYIINSATNTNSVRQWGVASDTLVPADYDGDGRADIAVWRTAEGNWYIINSSDNSITIRSWGGTGDVAVPGDYDRDGRADISVYRPSDSNFYIIRSSDGNTLSNLFSGAGDIAVASAPQQ